MDRKIKYTQQIKFLMEGMIALPETNRDEDATWRAMLGLITRMQAQHGEEDQQEPMQPTVQQPVQPTQPVDGQLMNNFDLAKRQGGAF